MTYLLWSLLFLITTSTAIADNNQFVLTTTFMSVARNDNGTVKFMNQDEANRYCQNQGARLPTARELARLAKTFGAKGIVNTCESNNSKCKLIETESMDGTTDKFYFDTSGFQSRYDNEIYYANNNLISSSRLDSEFSLSLSLYWGQILPGWTTSRSPVRCVSEN